MITEKATAGWDMPHPFQAKSPTECFCGRAANHELHKPAPELASDTSAVVTEKGS